MDFITQYTKLVETPQEEYPELMHTICDPYTRTANNWSLGDVFSGALFLLVPFLIAAALKTAQDSSAAALVVTSSLIAPMLPGLGIEGAVALSLVVMAVGTGAMTISHVNDSFFGIVTEFTGMKVSDAYKAQTMATLLRGLVTIIFAMILWVVLV